MVSKLLLKGLDILEQLPQLSSASYVVRFHESFLQVNDLRNLISFTYYKVVISS